MDALGREGFVFEQAYTYWPKTRASFVAMLTGRHAAMNGYSQRHRILFEFNPTLASVLQQAGYVTAAAVDNPNVAKSLGYAKGFAAYRETWEEPALATEADRARAISDSAIRFFATTSKDKPFFLWLHYVNPHAPYTPPPPYDTRFLDAEAQRGPALKTVADVLGGVRREWAVRGKGLGYYIAQYDGEIASVDAEVGRVLDGLRQSGQYGRTLIVLTSDHGESLGEHDYYFDHGANLMDPCLKIPLLIVGPGVAKGRRSEVLASTLDLVPTLLDAAKVSFPPDLSGTSLFTHVQGGAAPQRERLFCENDRGHAGTHDTRFKLVATPLKEGALRFALYDRSRDPLETHDSAPAEPDRLRVERRELELFFERRDREWAHTLRLVEGRPATGSEPESCAACEKLRALGYVQQCSCR
jgi:arylsulfatase A-like enzyme